MAHAAAITTRPFGPRQTPVPWLGQGTWQLEEAPRRQALAALQRGFDLGLTHVDTAEMYGSGRVEEILADAIAGRRDELFIVSKVLPANATYEGTIAACERSLARLRTDRLDCYLLHWPSSHALEETLRAFDDLERAGKIRSFGVSNFHADDIDLVVRLAGPNRVACNQVEYALAKRGVEREDLPRCARHGIAFVGYSPFAQGELPPARGAGKVLAEIARAHDATVPQVVLAFLGREPSVFLIPKAARIAHVEDNAAADGLVLDADEIRRIDEAFPVGPAPRARLAGVRG